MSNAMNTRSWATPLTISGFILMAGTGVLMFFGYDRGITGIVHQWMSWAFLMGAGGHVIANWLPLKKHLRSSWARLTTVTFVAVLAASCFSWGLITGPQLEEPIELSLADAPLSALASVRRVSPEVLVAKLAAQGVTATPHDTVRGLAVRHHIGANRLFGIIFDVS
jgi:hypothetical protein